MSLSLSKVNIVVKTGWRLAEDLGTSQVGTAEEFEKLSVVVQSTFSRG